MVFIALEARRKAPVISFRTRNITAAIIKIAVTTAIAELFFIYNYFLICDYTGFPRCDKTSKKYCGISDSI